MPDIATPASPNPVPAPSFSVYGDQADLLNGGDFNLGDTVQATVKVTGVREGDQGRSYDFEIVKVGGAGPGPDGGGEPPFPGEGGEDLPIPGLGEEGDEAPEETQGELPLDATGEDGEAESDDTEEESILGYKRPKGKKQAPKLSAKDLRD